MGEQSLTEWMLQELINEPVAGDKVEFQFRTSPNAPTATTQKNLLRQLEDGGYLTVLGINGDAATLRLSRAKLNTLVQAPDITPSTTIKTAKQPGNKIRVQLQKHRNQLVLDVEGDKYNLSQPLRTGMFPDQLFDFLLRYAPDERVTKTRLEAEGIKSSRNLDDVVIKAGLKGVIGKYFVVADSNSVKLSNEIMLDKNQVDDLIQAIDSTRSG